MQKEQEKEVARQRALVKDVLFPFLVKNTNSITEAKRLCYETQQILTQAFQMKVAEYQKKMSEAATSEMVFVDIMKKGKDFKSNIALYNLFKDENLHVTNALLGGMSNAIDSFVNEEISKRDLTTLKTAFL